MMKSALLTAAAVLSASALIAQNTDRPKPKRINRAIELLEAGQPIYYTGGRGGYEEGKKMAATKADYINYEMEHGAFDMKELRDFPDAYGTSHAGRHRHPSDSGQGPGGDACQLLGRTAGYGCGRARNPAVPC
jgi:hypothetical protein